MNNDNLKDTVISMLEHKEVCHQKDRTIRFLVYIIFINMIFFAIIATYTLPNWEKLFNLINTLPFK